MRGGVAGGVPPPASHSEGGGGPGEEGKRNYRERAETLSLEYEEFFVK